MGVKKVGPATRGAGVGNWVVEVTSALNGMEDLFQVTPALSRLLSGATAGVLKTCPDCRKWWVEMEEESGQWTVDRLQAKRTIQLPSPSVG
jgi:hypothetical protein